MNEILTNLTVYYLQTQTESFAEAYRLAKRFVGLERKLCIA